MKIFQRLALCLLAAMISCHADASNPTFKIVNPFDGHMEIKLLGIQQSKTSGYLLRLQFTKFYEIDAPDPFGHGDPNGNATSHKLCAQTSSVDLEIHDANNKFLGSTTVDVPHPGQKPTMVEIPLKKYSRHIKSPIKLKFDCTSYVAD